MTARPLETLREAWLILVLAAVFGASLAAVHTSLAGRIDANKRAETLRQLPALILGTDAVRGAEVQVTADRVALVAADGARAEYVVAERELAGHRVFGVSETASGDLAGWVVQGSGQGYADEIELLVGVDPQGETITGLFVLTQKETPALGDGITREDFRQRFVGRETSAPLEVTQAAGGGGILALTAATISSQSVCDIVNEAMAEVGPLLGTVGEAAPVAVGAALSGSAALSGAATGASSGAASGSEAP